MAYAVNADVEGEFKSIAFTASTLVTTSDITRFIEEAGALINSYVGMRYLVPITANSDSVALMRMYCVTLVADRIKKILEVKQTQTSSSAAQDVRGAYSTKDVLAALEKIRKGDLALAGASLATAGGGFFSSNADTGVKREFEKDTTQW